MNSKEKFIEDVEGIGGGEIRRAVRKIEKGA